MKEGRESEEQTGLAGVTANTSSSTDPDNRCESRSNTTSTIDRRDTMDQAQEDTATAIFDITYQCLISFDLIVAQQDESILTRSFNSTDATTTSDSQKQSSCDFLGLRNSFLFWIDYTGALSLMNSSLDARLQGLADISAMVIELLEMILRNMHRVVNLNLGDPSILSSQPTTSITKAQQTFLSKWDNASQAVNTALDRLHFIAVAIKKASAKQLDDTVITLRTEDDIVFRRDIASLVRYRFPNARKGLCQQLGDSIAVRRQMLLQNKRHAKRLAVRRVPENVPSARHSQSTDLEPKPAINPLVKHRIVSDSTALGSAVTKASRPDPQAPALKHLHFPKPRALTTVISSIYTTQEDSFEYPPPPIASAGETRVRCPFCFMPLEHREWEKKTNELWKHHVDEHLKPYACLFPECAESLVFFARRHEWKAHMESAHSKDWLRKVHVIVWYCDIDHDPPETFDTELQWRRHMQDLNSHPERKLTAPTRVQLDALSPRKQRVALRDKYACPLCEQIPEKIRPLVENGKGDPTDMYNFVVDHVANHMKSLSLMAVPSLENTTGETPGTSKESVLMMEDSFNRLMNENSVPKPPSGREHIDGISLPPEAWSFLNRDKLSSLTISSLNSSWDKEYLDYMHPDDPPEPSEKEWLERWNLWKSENDPFSQYSPEMDPILAHLHSVKATGSGQVSTQAIASNESNINSKDDAGRTPLSFAAETGDLAAARLFLDKGAQVEEADRDGQTPLLWAANNGHVAIVLLLLDQGARIEATDQIYGQTPLSWAASKGHQAVVKLLLDRGAKVDAADNSRRTPLSWAASRGHEATVRLLMQYGADIELPEPKYGRTPLSWAAVRGHEAIAKLLLDHGVNVDAADLVHGRTPLSWAAEKGHKALLQLLLSRGADIEAVDRECKQTPLSFAAEKGHDEIVRILLKQGANLEATDLQGRTALSWATENSHDSVAWLLRSHDAKIPAGP